MFNEEIRNPYDQKNFEANFNYQLPIGASYKLTNLGKSGYSPTMQSDSDKPYLTKNMYPELAQNFKDNQMGMKSGISPIYAEAYHPNGGHGIINTHSSKRDLSEVAEGMYINKHTPTIHLPNTTKSIGKNAFRDFTNLRSIIIPEGVTKIGSDAFTGCSSLTEINIPNSVTEIGVGVFENCTSLRKVTLSNSINALYYRTFGNCSSLTQIDIPNGVRTISNGYVFEDCTNLR